MSAPRTRSLSRPRTLPALVQRAASALFDIDEARLSPPRRAIVLVLRIVWLSASGFRRENLHTHAAALSFATMLAVVPAAALAFAIADVLGATDFLIEQTIEPFLADMLGDADDPTLPRGVSGLRSTLEGLLALVRETHVGGLGLAGLAVVLLALFRVLRGVDEAFAHIFEHRGPPRSIARRMRAFAIVAAATPIGLSYAFTSAFLTHDTVAGQWVSSLVPFEPLRDLALIVLPPVMVMLALVVLYFELPDAQIQPRSALLGAALAALGWYGVQLLHVRSQLGIARHNAIYSGFGAFPILMLSIYVSWVIVLLGAQVIAAHQNAPSLRQLARDGLRDHGERQALAVRATIELARDTSPLALRTLAATLGVGVRATREILDELVAHGLVLVSSDRTDRRYTLAVDAETLRASTVLDALERAPGEAPLPWEESTGPIRTLLVARRAAASSSDADRTIAELAATRESHAGE